MKEALLYEKKEDKKVLCHLCCHRCLISDGKFGICAVRQNIGGILYTHSYGNLISANVDPIEKKPVFHLLPGSVSYSIATAGCNFRCDFCQNWQISQKSQADRLGITPLAKSPDDIVEEAIASGCKSISYTYTEPTIFFEYALETGRIAKKKGLYNIFVTNGYMTKDCLEQSAGMLDAANVDLKSFSEEYYKKTCGARLGPVLETIEYMRKLDIWVEVTTLIVPGMNDSKEELKKIALFLAGVDKNMPWHISKFHPMYKLDNLAPTPLATLKMAETIGRAAGLNFVYLGNVPGEGEDTLCYNCNEVIIGRIGYYVKANRIQEGTCPKCKARIGGIWG